MKDYDRKKLANNIKTLRKQKNLNQAELGEILHVSQQTKLLDLGKQVEQFLDQIH